MDDILPGDPSAARIGLTAGAARLRRHRGITHGDGSSDALTCVPPVDGGQIEQAVDTGGKGGLARLQLRDQAALTGLDGLPSGLP